MSKNDQELPLWPDMKLKKNEQTSLILHNLYGHRVLVKFLITSFRYSMACFTLDPTALEPTLHSLFKNEGIHECIYITTTDVYLLDDFTHRRVTVFFFYNKPLFNHWHVYTNKGFYIHGCVHRDCIFIRSNKMQQYAGVYLLQN